MTTSSPQFAGRSPGAIVCFVLIVVLVFAADLASKAWAFESVADQPVQLERFGDNQRFMIPEHDAVTVIPNVLAFKLVLNRGAVFGLGQGGRWVFILMSALAVIVIGTIFYRSGSGMRLLHIALALVLGGALGNMYDRLLYGVVRDLLYLFPGVELPFGWQWPGGADELYPWIFNIADVALVLGIITLMGLLYLHHPAEEAEERPNV